MNHVGLVLPEWLDTLNRQPRKFPDKQSAMLFVIDVARRNIGRGGGPFGAIVVNEALELVSVGANRVMDSHCSLWHAETLALAVAQKHLRTHDLSIAGAHWLISSCAPCAMCLGALPFAGITGLYCAARGQDAEAIGFDEGDKPMLWADALRRRGMTVEEDLCRDRALELFSLYRARGGSIY